MVHHSSTLSFGEGIEGIFVSLVILNYAMTYRISLGGACLEVLRQQSWLPLGAV